ncbi:MAG: GntR family transcriptional regulator [Spirochaetales bacterium]|nr:MAG: GntR family transcriptional regulator [Spirochaetales bacterium]
MTFASNDPIYLQIADYICENILLQKWKPGDKIPSVRDMAVETEVNPNTVMRTYAFMQEKGIIYNQRGIGYFVAEDGYNNTAALLRQDFTEKELPRVFKTMDLLNMNIKDLHTYYEDYRNSIKQGEIA